MKACTETHRGVACDRTGPHVEHCGWTDSGGRLFWAPKGVMWPSNWDAVDLAEALSGSIALSDADRERHDEIAEAVDANDCGLDPGEVFDKPQNVDGFARLLAAAKTTDSLDHLLSDEPADETKEEV